MNGKMFALMAGLLLPVYLMVGCRTLTKQNLPDENATPLAAPVSYYGDIDFYDEKNTPLMVNVTFSSSGDSGVFAEILKNSLLQGNVKCAGDGSPFDVQVKVSSSWKEVTPAPQCRMENLLTLALAHSDGTKLLEDRQLKTEMLYAAESTAEAMRKMTPEISEGIRAWAKSDFKNNVADQLKVSILRFRMSRKFIELTPSVFEKDLLEVLNRIRSINGVAEVRMIEADRNTRMASFRVLCRKNIIFRDIIK